MSLSSLKLIFYQKSFTKEENACQNAFTSFDNIHQLQIRRSFTVSSENLTAQVFYRSATNIPMSELTDNQ